MAPDEYIKTHKKYCSCNPQWTNTKHGPALMCENDGALIYWPTPNTEQLTEEQALKLFVILPMAMDSDSPEVEDILLDHGYRTLTPENYDEALALLRKELSQTRQRRLF